jgi:hypothetical protein
LLARLSGDARAIRLVCPALDCRAFRPTTPRFAALHNWRAGMAALRHPKAIRDRIPASETSATTSPRKITTETSRHFGARPRAHTPRLD